ncbi:MAG: outer membrane beta-barrel protein [Nitrospinales bacterium]
MMLKSKTFQIILLVCSILLYFLTTNVLSAETKLLTSVGLRQEYNDNIFYTRTDETDDFISQVIPSLKLNYATEILKLSALARWDALLFWDNTDQNRLNQRYGLNGSYQLTERWSVSANGRYVFDSVQDSQLDETGSVERGLSDRQRLNAGAGLDYSVSERSDIGADYNYQKTDFERKSSVDTEAHGVRFFYRRRLQNQRDVITIFPRFVWGNSDDWDAYNSTLNFRWEHPFSETLDTSITVGARHSRVDYKDDRDNTNNWGGVADMWLRKRGELTTGRLGFSNRLRTRTNGEIINVSRLYTNIDHRLSRRFGVGFDGSIYYSNLIEDSPETDDDRWYFVVTPSAFYRLTERHLLRLSYSYNYQKLLDADDNDTVDRQRIWLELTFNFPKTW